MVADIRARDDHLSTGFLGTPYLCHVLTRFGYLDMVYDLLKQDTYPSWPYPITLGATTIWERWDGIKADGSFQDAGMNSFNHYAIGAIGHWLYSVVAGIDIGAPGYKHIRIQPHPGGGLTYARAAHQTLYGKTVSHWRIVKDTFSLDVTIPPNTIATVMLPNWQVEGISSGNY